MPIAFLLLQMLSGVSKSIAFLKYFTIYSVFDAIKVVGSGSVLIYIIIPIFVFIAVGAALFTASVYVFDKKDLSI